MFQLFFYINFFLLLYKVNAILLTKYSSFLIVFFLLLQSVPVSQIFCLPTSPLHQYLPVVIIIEWKPSIFLYGDLYFAYPLSYFSLKVTIYGRSVDSIFISVLQLRGWVFLNFECEKKQHFQFCCHQNHQPQDYTIVAEEISKLNQGSSSLFSLILISSWNTELRAQPLDQDKGVQVSALVI